MIGHQIVELAHQPLIGAEDDRADRARIRAFGCAA
jgi:hypothetical protein